MLEFVPDLYPDSGLLSKDPVQRARVRFFIDAVANKFFPPYVAFFYRGELPNNFIAGVAEVQELLPPGGFAVSDGFTLADAALAPFLSRADMFIRNNIGKNAEGIDPRVHKTIFRSERFARL